MKDVKREKRLSKVHQMKRKLKKVRQLMKLGTKITWKNI